MGTTLREIIYDIGGGIPDGRAFKAAQTGGPSGGCIPADCLDVPVEYDTLTRLGSMMGSGGLIVMDETTCMVDVAKFFLEFTKDESCGKCLPCREGCLQMLQILERITSGAGRADDIGLLEELADVMKSSALCGLGQTASNPVLSTLRHFRFEYEAHIHGQTCPAGVCQALRRFVVLAERCRGCGVCKRVCPAGAISGEPKAVHSIDQDLCLKCNACVNKCRFEAIHRA
jgi:NADP-reducing hydrogenase subunit HndC